MTSQPNAAAFARRITLVPIAAIGLAAAVLATSGCALIEDRPAGNMRSSDRYTYVSTPDYPVTVTIYDTRSKEILWEVDVPIGKKLTFAFYKNRSEDTELRPDLMRWTIADAKNFRNGLNNSMAMPAADSRMVAMSLREGPAYPAGHEPEGAVSMAGESDGFIEPAVPSAEAIDIPMIPLVPAADAEAAPVDNARVGSFVADEPGDDG